MLFNVRPVVRLTSQMLGKCNLESSYLNKTLLKVGGCELCLKEQKQNLHTSPPRTKVGRELEYRRSAVHAARTREIVKQTFHGDILEKRAQGYFPSADLMKTLFDDVPFKDLPIVNIKTTRNNTIMSLSDKGVVKVLRSCGMDGFKNTRKGTNVAAQTTGISFGSRVLKTGIKIVRVVLKGLGPGRLSAIKGLQLSGVNVASITDTTVNIVSQRPRKARRL